MIYSTYELLWLFFLCSFCGWLLETTVAAIRQKKFVNRGLVNLPFCVLYGLVAVFVTVFCQELKGIWLYIGSVVDIVVIVNLAGYCIEKIYHRKWWDFSKKLWNLGSYITIPLAACAGVFAVIMMKWGNALCIDFLHLMPGISQKILIWVLFVLLLVDVIATWIVLNGKKHRRQSWAKVDRKFARFTRRLSDVIYRHIEKRIHKAYPNSTDETEKKNQAVFAYGCSFYKLVWLFLIGAFGGDIVETIFCRITEGVWMSRSSVVWGPFSIVWGLAFVIATLILYRYQDKSDRFIFMTGVFLGGAYEYACSIFTEIVFGKVFWDYSDIPFNLGGRINLLYCFFWGIAAVIWMKMLYPNLSRWIEKIPVRIGKIASWIFILFMCCNMAVSCLALTRNTQRANHVPAEHSWQKIMDERFDDNRIKRIYPNALNTD